MLRQVLKLSASPRVLLRSVLALDDSPHAIALGTAIGIFIGLTPTVGIQTVLVLALVILSRPFVYFNATAAMLSTYISNPLTMVPLYYFWYRLGAWFIPGTATVDQFRALLNFDGFAGWWNTTCALAVQVGYPMLIGSLLVAPAGAAVAYPLTRFLVRWVRRTAFDADSQDQSSDSSGTTNAGVQQQGKPETGSAVVRADSVTGSPELKYRGTAAPKLATQTSVR